MQLSPSLLIACGANKQYADRYIIPLNQYAQQYEVVTPLRMAHFLSQVLHESMALSRVVENLNYSEEALIRTWPNRFIKALPGQRIDPNEKRLAAYHYARQPEKIANYVYANRGGNGDTASGDGWRYRGQGLIQITLKDNYIALHNDTGIDCVDHPELLQQPDYATLSAFWYWDSRELNFWADKDNPDKICRLVNGGLNGLVERKAYLIRAKRALGLNHGKESDKQVVSR